MTLLEKINEPALLLSKDGQIQLLHGELHKLQNFSDLEALREQQPGQIAFVIPFCAARENGMETLGHEPILAIPTATSQNIQLHQITALTNMAEVRFTKPFQAQISDAEFASEVQRIQTEEIAAGNACQVIYSRKFEARLDAISPLLPLTLFARLLIQPGQYLTFLFSDGQGHYFVGASPERQLEIHDELVIKNPISGTMPKADQASFPQRLTTFLEDQKEINELSQILDEELKIMSQICPRGGKITGPFLREAGAVIHTEYHLTGHSQKPAVTALRLSLHAPTLVGSPLESAFRIIAKHEPESRRYYGGEIGVLEPNGDMYSAIMIRTAEIFPDGRVAIQAGAGIVRDSNPLREAEETTAKAAGLIQAFQGETASAQKFISDALAAQLGQTLRKRNATFSRFHFEDQIGHRDLSNLHQERITIINNEDNFASVLSHITRYLGYTTTIVDTFDYDVSNDDANLVVLGPGPGDINDQNNPRMLRLLEVTADLASRNIPTLGICLGIQAMAKHMGMPVLRQAIPTQGLQAKIDLFGKKERVGMYNSFSPVAENVPDNFELSVNSENRVMALRSDNTLGLQFHVESAMTENGLEILKESLSWLMGVREKRKLSFESFVEESVSGKLNLAAQKEFLLELNQRGFSGHDIADLVQVFYKQMPVQLDLPGAIDLCGTGGSGLARINTSTLSALIVAACGIPVAKHGNKAASGRFGSFDLLESLGINIMAEKPRLETLYSELGLAFIFARSFHPVFKHFAEVRQELKTKTIFNLLGPLLNPANPEYQIIGTSNPEDMKLIVEAARDLGKVKVIVLNGSDGLDELTLTGETTVMTLENGEIKRSILSPEDFGLERASFAEISGGNETFNVKITREILSGSCKTPHLDLVLANTALALKFMGRVDSYPAGVALAREIIEKDLVIDLLQRYVTLSQAPDILMDIVTQKRTALEDLKKKLPLESFKDTLTVSDRDFKQALGDRRSLALIAEIKRSSPSDAHIYEGNFLPAEIAALYEQHGADAISVLTEEAHFKGSLDFLRQARAATRRIPLLMKDFIIDEYQVYLARHYGANAILLITAILSDAQIDHFTALATSLNMDVLLEAHTAAELKRALRSQALIIGINNRDLHSFTVDTKTVIRLGHHVPRSKVLVAESGYDPVTATRVQGYANAVLVGSAIMKSPDMASAIRTIKSTQKHFKACGIRTRVDAAFCEVQQIPYVGLNFVPASKRVIGTELARELCAELNHTISVGIFQDQTAAEVLAIACEVGLDMIQLSGSESPDYCREMDRPVIKTLKVGDLQRMTEYADVVSMFIVDGSVPGSGQSYDHTELLGFSSAVPVLVAGGVNDTNAHQILSLLPQAAGVDAASGIETNGVVDRTKILNIARHVTRVQS